VIGSDSVNRFAARGGRNSFLLDVVGHRCLSDQVPEKDGRKFSFSQAATAQHALRVYDFFERQADCRYFWDGDVCEKVCDRNGRT
jgi:hypothetical protein